MDSDEIAVPTVQAAWARDEVGAILPRLVLSNSGDLTYEVSMSFRATFATDGSYWTAGPFEVEPGTPLELDVSLPVDAHRSDLQATFFTDLHFGIHAVRPGSDHVASSVGPPLRMVWDEHAGAFDLYDVDQARTVGPHGFVGVASPDLAAVLNEEEGNVEFGPGI